jgi:hypothetical protein
MRSRISSSVRAFSRNASRGEHPSGWLFLHLLENVAAGVHRDRNRAVPQGVLDDTGCTP